MRNTSVNIETNPVLKTYVDVAYLLSVVTKENPNYVSWITSYYTQIVYWHNNDDGHCLSFLYGKYYECPFVKMDIQPKEMIHSKEEFIDFIYDSLKNKYCLIIEFNEYYIPDRRSYKNKYRRHSSLVYRISEEFSTAKIIGYKANGDYGATEVNLDELYNSFSTVTEEGWPIIRIRRNDTVKYDIEWWKIEFDLKEYRNGGREEPAYGGKDLFGIEAFKKLISVMEEIKEGRYRKDIRLLSMIMEHKSIMLDKIKYFIDFGIIFDSDNVLQQYEEIANEAKICFKMFLKYSITNDEKLINDIIMKLKEIINKENDIYYILNKGIKETMKVGLD